MNKFPVKLQTTSSYPQREEPIGENRHIYIYRCRSRFLNVVPFDYAILCDRKLQREVTECPNCRGHALGNCENVNQRLIKLKPGQNEFGGKVKTKTWTE